jgi:hypothetical protein
LNLSETYSHDGSTVSDGGTSDLVEVVVSRSPVYFSPNEIKNFSFTLYPNPASDYFQINFIDSVPASFNIIVRDVSGRVVLNKEFSDVQKNTVTFSFQDWSSGVYLVQLTVLSEVHSRNLYIIETGTDD